jgi:hypothetical protein
VFLQPEITFCVFQQIDTFCRDSRLRCLVDYVFFFVRIWPRLIISLQVFVFIRRVKRKKWADEKKLAPQMAHNNHKRRREHENFMLSVFLLLWMVG